MEKIKILGIDPSLRNTGLAIVSYNTELDPNDSKSYEISHCQVLVNPRKYTGTEAILNMLDMMNEESQKEAYKSASNVIVESPAIMFNKKISSSVVASLAHISGGAVALFGIEKSDLFRPSEWNKTRKKETTYRQTIDFLGDPDLWHYEKRVKSEMFMEHILDAVSMSLWWIKTNYSEE